MAGTNTKNAKPIRKNYKSEKAYKKALDIWKKNNSSPNKKNKNTLKKTKYTGNQEKGVGNYVPMITSNSESSQPFSEATDPLVLHDTKRVVYTKRKVGNVFSRKDDPTVPVDVTINEETNGANYEKFLNTDEIDYKDLNLSSVRSILDGDTLLAKGKTLKDMVVDIHDAVMLPSVNETSTKQIFDKYRTYYNRFKLPDYNIPLQKGFAHVFFVRPSCNILKSNGKLVKGLDNHPLFTYALNNSPGLLGELCMANSGNKDNQFMMSLSNFVSSFSLNDEYINTDTYGKTYTGFKVAYGKHDVESKTAGTIDINFSDDASFHVYQIIRLWVEYISGVYRGEFSPKNSDVFNKVLDYTGSIYYIITAEDGETILFWSKYYGVFPSTIPASQYAWGEGNLIQSPQLSVTFNYSFKEDFNPYSILEYNYNSKIEDTVAKEGRIYSLPIYDASLGHSSWKWGQKPFIQLVKSDPGISSTPYVYKLRFTQKSKGGE